MLKVAPEEPEPMSARLLIVDDNPQFLTAARDLLTRQGCEVVAVASNGAEAVRLATQYMPDAVLVDVDLGPENGFEVAQGLVSEHRQRVVMISAYGEGEFAEIIASSPALGFISKAELSAGTIRALLVGEQPG